MLLKRILILFLLPTTCALAQDLTSAQADMPLAQEKIAPPKRFISRIDVFLGPSLSEHWKNNSSLNQVSNITFSYGIGISHTLNNKFDIDLKFYLERKGFKADDLSTYLDPFNNNTPITVQDIRGSKLDYATISVCPRYFFDKMKHFYLGIGGYAAYLRGANSYTKTYSLQGDLISYYSADQLSQLKKYDLGLTFNLGYMNSVSNRLSLNIQLVNNLGLIDIINHNQSNINPSDKLKNNIISLLVGISFKNRNYALL